MFKHSPPAAIPEIHITAAEDEEGVVEGGGGGGIKK